MKRKYHVSFVYTPDVDGDWRELKELIGDDLEHMHPKKLKIREHAECCKCVGFVYGVHTERCERCNKSTHYNNMFKRKKD